MADQDQPNQPLTNEPNPGGLTPGLTPEGSSVGPQPTDPATDNTVQAGDAPVVDTGPKAGPNSEGQAPAPDAPEAPAAPESAPETPAEEDKPAEDAPAPAEEPADAPAPTDGVNSSEDLK